MHTYEVRMIDTFHETCTIEVIAADELAGWLQQDTPLEFDMMIIMPIGP